MPVEFSMQLSGSAQLERNLREMGKALEKRVVRDALRKAAQPIAEDAGRRAPRGTGALVPRQRDLVKAIRKGKDPMSVARRPRLADSMAVRSTLSRHQRRLRKSSGRARAPVAVYVGPTVPHAHLIEFGHRLRKRDKRGNLRTVGFVGPRPFLRPAWDANKARIIGRIRPELAKAIDRAAKRLARQAKRGKLSRTSVRSLAGR